MARQDPKSDWQATTGMRPGPAREGGGAGSILPLRIRPGLGGGGARFDRNPRNRSSRLAGYSTPAS
jgi:hypothetical protein